MPNSKDSNLFVLSQLYETIEDLPPSPEYSYVILETLLKLRKLYLQRRKLGSVIELAKEVSHFPNPPKNVDPELKEYFNIKYAEDLVAIVNEIDQLMKQVERYMNDISEDLDILEGLLKRKCDERCEALNKVREAKEMWSSWSKNDLDNIIKDGKSIYTEVLRILKHLQASVGGPIHKNWKERFKHHLSVILRMFLSRLPRYPPEEGEGK